MHCQCDLGPTHFDGSPRSSCPPRRDLFGQVETAISGFQGPRSQPRGLSRKVLKLKTWTGSGMAAPLASFKGKETTPTKLVSAFASDCCWRRERSEFRRPPRITMVTWFLHLGRKGPPAAELRKVTPYVPGPFEIPLRGVLSSNAGTSHLPPYRVQIRRRSISCEKLRIYCLKLPERSIKDLLNLSRTYSIYVE